MDGNHLAELAVYLLKGLGVPDFNAGNRLILKYHKNVIK